MIAGFFVRKQKQPQILYLPDRSRVGAFFTDPFGQRGGFAHPLLFPVIFSVRVNVFRIVKRYASRQLQFIESLCYRTNRTFVERTL